MQGVVDMGQVSSGREMTAVWFGRLGFLFGIWLFLSVSAPEVVFRTFFHALILPLTAYLALHRRDLVDLKEPFIAVFILFCAYMSVSTWFVGSGPVKDDWQASRWGVEAAFGMLAFRLWMSSIVRYRAVWGYVFLCAALLGSLAGLATDPLPEFGRLRTGGLGMLEHPIQGASIAIVLMAIGLFIMLHKNEPIQPAEVFFAALVIVATCVFVIMTKSRAPILTMCAYLAFFVVVLAARFRPYLTAFGVVIAGAIIVVSVQSLVGFEPLIEQLFKRGDAHRFDIWEAYASYPPESLWFGNGAGMDFKLMDASRQYLEPLGLDISHPHNIWLGVWAETGVIGVAFQLALLGLPALWAIKATVNPLVKFHLLALLALFVMLTFTDEYTLLISLHPVWLIGWLPLVFVWSWACSAHAGVKKQNGAGEAYVR
ncbi:O-antigen ligase [Marinobacter sp. SS5-14b]|uniref:O-antigen ligase family protein n=1 Tax=Marinobacter sp. SS5-14b TaxID=3050456 RepID=UPI0026DF21BF|nr:O-antigen ligase family protein [Marinobacter sp. SS5-14b]